MNPSDSTPTPAATCIPLVPKANGFNVVLVQRASTMRFMPNAYAFPGGKVDPVDREHAENQGWTAEHFAAVRELCEETSMRTDVSALRPWSQWITPTYETKRFAAQFFVAEIADPTVVVDGSETVSYRSASAIDLLLDAQKEGGLLLPPPVLVTLRELTRFSSASDAIDFASQLPAANALSTDPRVYRPWRETRDGEDRLYLHNEEYLIRQRDQWALIASS